MMNDDEEFGTTEHDFDAMWNEGVRQQAVRGTSTSTGCARTTTVNVRRAGACWSW